MKTSILLGGAIATVPGTAQYLAQVRIGAGLPETAYQSLTLGAVIERYNATVDALGVGQHVDAGITIPDLQAAIRGLAHDWNEL
jgi:hypothetical protein